MQLSQHVVLIQLAVLLDVLDAELRVRHDRHLTQLRLLLPLVDKALLLAFTQDAGDTVGHRALHFMGLCILDVA